MARYCRCPGVAELNVKCGRRLPTVGDCEFDHIGQRSVTGDDSMDNYRPLCHNCHNIKSNGLGGDKRITTAGSDANRRAKIRRVERSWSDFMQKMRGKCGQDETPLETRPRSFKRHWPKRPFPKKP